MAPQGHTCRPQDSSEQRRSCPGTQSPCAARWQPRSGFQTLRRTLQVVEALRQCIATITSSLGSVVGARQLLQADGKLRAKQVVHVWGAATACAQGSRCNANSNHSTPSMESPRLLRARSSGLLGSDVRHPPLAAAAGNGCNSASATFTASAAKLLIVCFRSDTSSA
jgi:hypothetical protein